MKICVFWAGAFWFALLKLFWENKKIESIYAYEKDKTIIDYLARHNTHPYFFEWVSLSDRIIFITDFKDILSTIDIIIFAIPSQFIPSFLPELKPYLKTGVILLNLSKGINNQTLTTTSEDVEKTFKGIDYHYAILSGWMIAREVVEGKALWAQIGVDTQETGKTLQSLFDGTSLDTEISIDNIKNIELYSALKNIVALMMGYYEGQGNSPSTLGYYMCRVYKEIHQLLPLLWGNDQYNFSDYAIWGDLIATCFGDSRNRYLWKLVWSGIPLQEALETLSKEKKRSEWYETLKGLKDIISQHNNMPLLQNLCKTFL